MSIVNIRNIWNYPFKQTNPLTGRCQANLKCHFLHKKEQKLVDLNWYMFSPQIAGWRQNCSVWTSYIIISICCLNEGSYMIYLNVYNQFYVLQFYIHKKETRQKSAWRRGWRADRRKIWRRSRKFSSFIWLKLLHRWVPFCSINTYLGPSVGGRILRTSKVAIQIPDMNL